MVRLPVPPLPHEDGERILAGSDRQGKSNVAANKLPPRCASEGSQEWFTPLNATPGPTKPLLFSRRLRRWRLLKSSGLVGPGVALSGVNQDRKSTRLNSSHSQSRMPSSA